MSKFYIKVTLIVLFLSALILFFTGCTTHNKFVKYANNHKLELAELCTENFPVQTRLIKGDTDTITKIEYKDSIIVRCPPVEAKNGQIINNTVKCPPASVITKYLTRVDTLIKPDSALTFKLNKKLESQSDVILKLQEDFKKEEKSKDRWRNIAIGALLSCGVLIYFLIRK